VNATNTEIASLNAGLARTKEKTSAASMSRLVSSVDVSYCIDSLFGVASSLLASINKQKKKHTFVLAAVAGVCICFIVWWWLSSK
jgi:hypothetical protein